MRINGVQVGAGGNDGSFQNTSELAQIVERIDARPNYADPTGELASLLADGDDTYEHAGFDLSTFGEWCERNGVRVSLILGAPIGRLRPIVATLGLRERNRAALRSLAMRPGTYDAPCNAQGRAIMARLANVA